MMIEQNISSMTDVDVAQVGGGKGTVTRSEVAGWGAAVTGAGAVAFGVAGLATAGAAYGVAAAGFGLYAAYCAMVED